MIIRFNPPINIKSIGENKSDVFKTYIEAKFRTCCLQDMGVLLPRNRQQNINKHLVSLPIYHNSVTHNQHRV